MHTAFHQEEQERWRQLLVLLSGRSDLLTERFLGQLGGIEDYADFARSDEVRATAVQTFHGLLSSLATGSPAPELLDLARELGSRRARQRVPPDSLTAAVRLDFGIIWNALLEISSPEDADLLTRRVERVWQVVDNFATQTYLSYSAERIAMAREEADVRRGFIDRLFDAAPSEEGLAAIAQALGVRAQDTFTVVTAAAPVAAGLRAAVDAARAAERDVFTHQQGQFLTAFWVPPTGPGAGRLLPGLERLPCGLVPRVPGLRAVPGAAAAAGRLAGLLDERDRGPVSLSGGWVRLASHLLLDAGVDLRGPLDDALGQTRLSERERLKETVELYLATGSVSQTAADLYCHRNTILNRLRRFRELTGLDVTVPDQAARVVVAWA